MVQYGPMVAEGAICAPGATMAVGWMLVLIRSRGCQVP
jgi:hypothetical protein